MNVGEVRINAIRTPLGSRGQGCEALGADPAGVAPVDGFEARVGSAQADSAASPAPATAFSRPLSERLSSCPVMALAGLGSTGPTLAVARACACQNEASLRCPLTDEIPVSIKHLPSDPDVSSLVPQPDDVSTERRKDPGPPPPLPRPVLMVHGYNSGDWVFDRMAAWMVGPHGEVNPHGGSITADVDAETLDPNARLFSLRLSKPWQCAEKNADELEQALEAICRATGAPRVDIVAHSMGAVDARVYLDRGGDRIGKLAMVAPPNHGSIEANAELWLRDTIGVPVFPPNKDPDVREALVDLTVDGEPGSGPLVDGNPFLHGLNERWEEQKARTLGVAIMVGGGVPTPEPDGSISLMGDGFVPWSSSALPDVRMRFYSNPLRDTHGKLVRDELLAADVAKFLANPGVDRVEDGGDGVVVS